MHQHTKGFGNVRHQTAIIAGDRLQDQYVFLTVSPTINEGIEHPHGFDDFSVTQVFVGIEAGGDVFFVRCSQSRTGHAFVEDGKNNQDDGADDCHPAIPRMEHEHHCDIDRQPRRVKKSKQPIARHKLTQPGKVIKGLG